ncbi:hypothetical protein EV714DRAFT_275947 [Schizophyllum commune]
MSMPANSLAESLAVIIATSRYEEQLTDEQIDLLQSALLRGLTRKYRTYNERAPINRLHFETLGNIFRLPLTPLSDFALPWKGPSLQVDMIYTVHVCKRWRGIALATRSLWTTIAMINRDAAATAFLQCSLAGPLSVLYYGRYNHGRYPAALRDIIDHHLHRVEHLLIHRLKGPYDLRGPAH